MLSRFVDERGLRMKMMMVNVCSKRWNKKVHWSKFQRSVEKYYGISLVFYTSHGPENSRQFLNQSGSKLKPNATRSLAFS